MATAQDVIFLWMCPQCRMVFDTKNNPTEPTYCKACGRPEATFPDYLTWGRSWRFKGEDYMKMKAMEEWF